MPSHPATRPPRALGTILLAFLLAAAARTQDTPQAPPTVPLSEATESCLFCHENLNPGLVADWRRSRHARTTVQQALQRPELQRRVSATAVPPELANVAVGCAECHTLHADAHPDTVVHGEHRMHVVVTPRDCAVCHPVENDEFQQNLMAHAHDNLVKNELYQDLQRQTTGGKQWNGTELTTGTPHLQTDADGCLACHGTKVEVLRKEKRATGLGEMEFAVLSGWPNQGVGRVNPDQTTGACSACHTRHEFSIEMARKPHTCGQCHKGPDVPAYQVYLASKHGNLFETHGGKWDFDAVPWVPGRDFTAPTCATCHVSLLATADGTVIQKRTHRMNDRLFTRLFGLPYAHPHPRAPTTHTIRNQAGLPLPTELSGEPVAAALIDATEQAVRRTAMQAVCHACHSRSYVAGHFERLDHTIEETNALTRTATQMLQTAWAKGLAKGLDQRDSLFNEPIELLWVEQWLFHANSVRFAAAMMGADHGVFAGGRWQLTKGLREMEEKLQLLGNRK